LAAVATFYLALWPVNVAAAPDWMQWQSVAGVFDLGGPRADGSLVVAGSAALYTLTPTGDLEPFARGPGGYRDDPNTEAYAAVSPGQRVAASGCNFTRDDLFVLRLHNPFGVTRVDRSGEDSGSFTNVDAPSLNGIAFDTAGAFDHRLLVTGPVSGKTVVVAVDCRGAVQVLTKTAPQVEGGMEVAPETFGVFAGSLIAADENSGVIWAIAPDGTSKQVAGGLPKGGDVGVESVGFVPPGFSKGGGYLYYADRKSVNTPYLGTDRVLRLASADLVQLGIQDGNLLVATEGGAALYDVRCTDHCQVTTLLAAGSAHGEGHLVFTLNPQPSPSPTGVAPSATPTASSSSTGVPWLIATAVALLAAVAGASVAVAMRRRR
jgi:hypothetical protein